MLADAIPSVGTDQSILYTIRDDMPDKTVGGVLVPWTSADAANDKERLMYQVALSGHEYNSDNRRLWAELKPRVIASGHWEWIKEHDAESDGRKGWFSLKQLMEGEENTNKRLQMATRMISMSEGGVTYNNENLMTFITYATKILKGYNIIKRYRNETAVETMVQRLLDGIKIKESVEVKIAMSHVCQKLLGNWNEVVAYLSN